MAVTDLLRELAPQVLGALARRHRDFAAAEDAVQEALLAASQQWPAQGVPDDPRAWLVAVASRRLIDHVRAEVARRRRQDLTVLFQVPLDEPAHPDAPEEQDDTLVLLLMCCHPALPVSSAVALTLRAVAGLTTAEIARAYLVPEATMAQRISRAKRTIRTSGVGFAMPTAAELDGRVATVLAVLYLIFNEGYLASSGASLQRTDLAREAIRLARMLHAVLPEHAEVAGLLALVLLTDARRAARTGPDGELVSLDEQDRTLWDRAAIAEGTAIVEAAFARGAPGPYQLQAAIAALHDEATRAADTDWPQIVALYEVLDGIGDNPMVTLNRAVAVAMVHGPTAGLAMLRALDGDPRIAGHFRLDVVRGHLYERAGDRASAIAHFGAAARGTRSLPERAYLLARAARLAHV
ncbi:MAG: sigma-70 family RNA polymerase sigma factor [Deltaproteobacteria bacterium]|nr:sigma-70 family RNA polymerase sigma factor [Deltaproteobacteria bacterium]